MQHFSFLYVFLVFMASNQTASQGLKKYPSKKQRSHTYYFHEDSCLLIVSFIFATISFIPHVPIPAFSVLVFSHFCAHPHNPHFFQPFSPPLIICDPFPYHHQPFGRSALPPPKLQLLPRHDLTCILPSHPHAAGLVTHP